MMQSKEKLLIPKLFLPNPDGNGPNVEIQHNGSVVIIGANGAGKSRLGAWIERNTDNDIVHRISAQRALDIPEYATVKSLEQSLNDLLWGNEQEQYANKTYKWGHKWGNHPETYLQQDYGKVLSTLFATSADRDRKHTEQTKELKKYIPVEDSPIDILIKLWNEILPHRELVLKDGKVKVIDKNTKTEYHGKEMSDGERVALYLMGQCLVAPSGSIFIVDEPEIHLHTSIMQTLWNKLEEAKQDCLFIYITHDLGFASTRVSSTNIWVKQFNGGNSWQWNFVPDIEEMPEALLLELMGNRRTIIFVEGEKGGKDHSIYQSIFRNCSVVPRNGCQKVIDSVKAMSLNNAFHHVNVYGIIDRDYRTDDEIEGLAVNNIFTIDVAEIENILLNESTLRIIATNQVMDPDAVVSKSLDIAKSMLTQDIERQVSLRTCKAIENKLSRIDNKSVGLEKIKDAVTQTIHDIDVDCIYQENTKLYADLLTSNNLDEILKYFNNKGLLPNICSAFELGKNGYEKLVLRMLNSDKRESLLEGLRKYVPTI